MIKQAAKNTVISLDALKSVSEFEISALLDGFVLFQDEKIPDFDMLSNYYRSDFFQLALITSGNASVSINLSDYDISKDNLLFCSPFDIKKINSSEDCENSMLMFTSAFLERSGLSMISAEILVYFTSQYVPKWELREGDTRRVYRMLADLKHRHDEIENHVYGKELFYLSFTALMYELLALGREYATTIGKPKSRKEAVVSNFMSLLKEHFKEEPRLSYYAALLHITPKYLTETVKQVTGKPAGKIIEGFVLQEAKMLLGDPSLSVAQVSDALHFKDPSLFGKFFKRSTGYSPSQFRKI